jgi:hypothetical protein
VIDHVTYQVQYRDLTSEEWVPFFKLILMTEVEPDPVIEKDWKVRWFSDDGGTTVHLVGNWRRVPLDLGHFCVKGIGPTAWQKCLESEYLEHHTEGSPRLWLRGPAGIRVEVHA